MIKTIRTYEVEKVSGVARFINSYAKIYEMTRDHRIDAKDAIADMRAAIKKADLSVGEKFAVIKASSTSEYLYDEEERLFFSACAKIAEVFRAEGYGVMEINRFVY
ncbi:hypothetical protein H1164_03865 [Thermoactinomyces daqus]|uniref:Uncharacterized protein n=1 Tax=Thermoactinomyces daqus TaxID=1329516 RepID=A0A7W2AHP5_9BACL|nr:hypothetical protein [Thermoactinomyces daqus]MBA4542038.1 hypothetical protein [Thermoactinomyces daqus]